MKSIISFLPWFGNVRRLLGGRGTLWIGIGMFSSFILAGTEYIIALLIVVFLFTFRLVDSSQIPSWLFFDVKTISPTIIWLILLTVGVLRAVAELISRQTSHVILEFVQARLKMIQGYQMLIAEKEQTTSLSQINTRMGESFPRASDYVFHFAELISQLTQTVVLSAGMFYLAWQESLVGILCLSTAGLIIFKLSGLLTHLSAKILQLRAQFEKTLVRICRNWLLIRILHLRNREYRVYMDSVLTYFKSGKKAFFLRNISGVLPPFLGILAIVVIILTSVKYFKTSSLVLVAFIYLFMRFTRAAVMATDHVGALNHFQAQFKESLGMFSSLSPDDLTVALRPEQAINLFKKDKNLDYVGITETSPPDISPETKGDMSPDITVCNVTFSWPEMKDPVFRNLSLRIPAGSQFGIVGPNGSGKSTLLGIILGVLKPSAGHVLIDRVRCAEYVKKSHFIGYVGEDPYLIHGSIRENLIYGIKEEVSDKGIWNVLEMVRLDSVAKNVTGGLKYMIQEDGQGLSSGQKQRLALARAFLRKPRLLVLDEASANLDKTAEEEIANILKQMVGHCTTIIVSHKPGILKGVEHILDLGFLRNGQLS